LHKRTHTDTQTTQTENNWRADSTGLRVEKLINTALYIFQSKLTDGSRRCAERTVPDFGRTQAIIGDAQLYFWFQIYCSISQWGLL